MFFLFYSNNSRLSCNEISTKSYWLCKIQGVQINEKRQYHFQAVPKIQSITSCINESMEVEIKGENANSHLTLSVFQELLDVPLPNTIIID